MNENEDQSADPAEPEPEVTVRPYAESIGLAIRNTGSSEVEHSGDGVALQSAAHPQGATAGAVGEQRRGVGRRVNLVRTEGGYQIRMGDRVVQGFCDEWEDITRFQLPVGIQQQIRINVEQVGRAREYEEPQEETKVAEERLETLAPDAQNTPRIADDDLINMFRALPGDNQARLAAEIRASYHSHISEDIRRLRETGDVRTGRNSYVEAEIQQRIEEAIRTIITLCLSR